MLRPTVTMVEEKITEAPAVHTGHHRHAPTTNYPAVRGLASGGLVGLVFGLALEKSKMALPQVIRAQFVFADFSMVKVFLSAVAMSSVSFAVLEHLQVSPRPTPKALALGFGTMRGYGANVAGGLIMGAGIALSGACPGTVLAQLGSGVQSAYYAAAGCVAGTVAFAAVHGAVQRQAAAAKAFHAKRDSVLLDRALGARSMLVAAAAVAAGVAALLVGLEWALPRQRELPTTAISQPAGPAVSGVLGAATWSPYLSGMLIGALQVPSLLLVGHPISASGAYVTATGSALSLLWPAYDQTMPYYRNFFSIGDYGQLGCMIGVLLSSWASVALSQASFDRTAYTDSPLTLFLGGFMVLFGARLAGGCASGHGISGLGRLSQASLIVCMAMFAGGILASLLFL